MTKRGQRAVEPRPVDIMVGENGRGNVIIEFDHSVKWAGMTPAQALELAQAIEMTAKEVQKRENDRGAV